MKKYDVIKTESIEVKKLYLPLIVNVKCPTCNRINDHDFTDNYLSYPILNKPETISVYCSDCENYFDVNIVLKITIEIDEESAKAQ